MMAALLLSGRCRSQAPHSPLVGAPTLLATDFPGSDPATQMNACLQAARIHAEEGKGGATTCDARSYSGTYLMKEQITVPSKTVLLLPHFGNWLWDLRDGVSAGILQEDNSSLLGDAPGGGGNQMILGPASNSTYMLALYATEVLNGEGGSYIYASGFNAQNLDLGGKGRSFPGARFTHGLVYTRHLYDESRFERIMAENDYGDAWHIANTCCDTEFVQVQATSSHLHGGTPLTVENGAESVRLDAARHEVAGAKAASGSYAIGPAAFSWSGTVNGAGPGHPNILIEPNNAEIVFPYLYTETVLKGSADATAPIIDNAGHAQHITILSGGLQLDGRKPLFSHPHEEGLFLGPWAAHQTFASDMRGGRLGLGSANARDLNNALVTMYGTVAAANVQFRPTGPGWYQIFGGYPGLRGAFEIQAGFGTNITGLVAQNFYGGAATITVLDASRQEGTGNNPVDAVATWSPGGGQRAAMAVHVASLPNDGAAISINLLGQGFDSRGVLQPTTPMAAPPLPTAPSYAEWRLPESGGPNGIMSSAPIAAPRFTGQLSTPKTSGSPCAPGQSWDDASFHYVCVGPNHIRRVALSDF